MRPLALVIHMQNLRILSIATLAAMLAPAAAGQSETRLEVVTTLGVLEDLAQQVGGERVHAVSLANPSEDPHYVEPKPTLMQRARSADVFVQIGLQLELWADKVADGSGNARIAMGQPGRVIASAGVATLELPANLSREWGDVHPYGNPHIWLDPLNAKKMAENIELAYVKLDPAHAAEYEQRLHDFEARIDAALFGPELVEQVGGDKLSRLLRQGRLSEYLQSKDLGDKLGGWLKQSAPLRGRPLLTYHKTSAYLADRFGFRVPVEIEEKPGIPPSARHRDHVLEVIRQQGIHTILQELFYDRSAADYLAAQTGAHVVVVPIDVGPSVGVKDYFALIQGLLDAVLQSEFAK
jgi:zinc/manganese transport system substrate-binding protein